MNTPKHAASLATLALLFATQPVPAHAAPGVAPTSLVADRAEPLATRDPLKQPFASASIWNLPIGSGARYVPADIDPITHDTNEWAAALYIDPEHIVLRPTAPLTSVYFNGAGWSGGDRCRIEGGELMRVPIPADYVVPSDGENSSTSFLMPDRRTLKQTQPFARCVAGRHATSWTTMRDEDLYGPGIEGAHGGSALSAIGGSLRVGELRPGDATGPRHALKAVVYAKREIYRCRVDNDCYRWPAGTADGYAVGWYGTIGNNSNFAMRMGALLAIPAAVDIGAMGLETEPARKLAWTLQNYGAYIVDDTYGEGFALAAEDGPDGSFRAQFKADWGFDIAVLARDDTPWRRDIRRLQSALYVVDNNAANSIGGGGTPRQPLAPEIHP